MFEELGMGDVLDHATHHNPDMRDLTVGEAVKAMVLHGLGCINQALYRVPRFFQNQPTSRLIAPRVTPKQLNDDALGRAFDTLSAAGVTALYRLMAATAAQRLGLTPRVAHLDRTSVHGDGRDNSDEAPDAQVMHLTRGYSRDHRPDLHQVMLELMVEHQAGMPVLMPPLSGNSRDAQAFGQLIREHMAQLRITSGTTSLVADSALDREANRQKLAQTPRPWITRVPVTFSDARAALVQADPQTMLPLVEGYRDQELASTSGGVEQGWVRAFKKRCGTACACEAEAPQALATFAQGLQATFLATSRVCPTSRDGQRGRPRPGRQPASVVDHINGAFASRLALRHALVDQHSCFILATHELDATLLPPPALLPGDTGQSHAERGVRFRQDPPFFASSLYRKTPERIMALVMVMTGCWRGYAALEYRIRKALKEHGATCPDHKGQPTQHPTARWVFHSCVGIHV
jgi:transposase